jgi:hypothetical protein
MNPWIQHVVDYQKENGVSYKEALRDAAKTYNKSKKASPSIVEEEEVSPNLPKKKQTRRRRKKAKRGGKSAKRGGKSAKKGGKSKKH